MRNAGGISGVWPVLSIATLCVLGLFIAGCQTKKPEKTAKRDNAAAIALLQKVNSGAQACWVKSKDKAFRNYRVIPELDTRAGKPRILIVEAKKAQGLPKMVIEADGTPAKLSTYGPLSNEPISARINEDVARWRTGSTACTA
jgi:hypothetical protein